MSPVPAHRRAPGRDRPVVAGHHRRRCRSRAGAGGGPGRCAAVRADRCGGQGRNGGVKTPPPPLEGLGREADQGRGEGESWSPALLLDAAVDVLVAMQRAAFPPGLPAWDAAAMAQTALGTLLDWWWPAVFGMRPAPAAARADFAAALDDLLRPVAAGPVCFTHRDYFAGNLLWLPQSHRPPPHRRARLPERRARPPRIRPGVAAAGRPPRHPAGAGRARHRRDTWPPAASWTPPPSAPPMPPAPPSATCAWPASGSGLRCATDGAQYLAHGPRTWRMLADALRHPAAAPLAQAMDRWVPPDLRANPEGLTA